ncbi:hypothetical protein TRFO_38526 [Tritrichomonas foetus]|uniref:Protein kinase domain-containing protein n=1 Tax=Tritrichomonas foetus TaxID=1144522 RepID=A0A1J4J890_9EUKA|nr:hypothetical protein TRFO_38526 [Tritrichomonas foetus]|eukprot:OHS95360.1 hypothetical protein TRFO_38526 [Tritrichomonas foetus]
MNAINKTLYDEIVHAEYDQFECRYSTLTVQSINDKKYYVLHIDPPIVADGYSRIEQRIEKMKSLESPLLLVVNKDLTERVQSELKLSIIYEYKKLWPFHYFHKKGVLKDSTIQTKVTFGIACAMEYLHNNNVFHGRLNDKSILFDENCNPIIIDYGLTVHLNIINSQITEYIHFIAPETMIKNGNINGKVDIYSYGMLCHLISHGKISFKKSLKIQPYDILIRSGKRPFVPNSVSLEMRDIIQSCTLQNAKDRPSFSLIIKKLIQNAEFIYSNANLSNIYQYIEEIKSQEFLNLLKLERNLDYYPKFKVYIPKKSTLENIKSRKNIHHFLTSIGHNEALLSTHLQSALLDLNEYNIHKVSFVISDSLFVKGSSRMTQLCRNIFNCVRIGHMKIELYVNLMIEICNKFIKLKKYMYRELFRVISSFTYVEYIPNITFLYYLVQKKFVSGYAVVKKMKSLDENNTYSKCYLLLMLCFFPNEVIIFNPMLFNKLINIMKENQNKNNFPSDFKKFFQNISQYKESNWTCQKEFIENRGKIPNVKGSLYSDNVKLINELLSSQSYNSRIESDIYDPCIFSHQHPSIIACSALYGSSNCFKYLQLNGADIYFHDEKNRSLFQYIIAGGNTNLVKFGFNSNLNIYGILNTIILFHQNEIYDKYVKGRTYELLKKDVFPSSMICFAAGVNNINILLDYFDNNGNDINKNYDVNQILILDVLHFIQQQKEVRLILF